MIDEGEENKSQLPQPSKNFQPKSKIDFENETIAEISIKIKNRRFAKLKQMREQGFFIEQDIMLRYPSLYYQYVGKYKKNMVAGHSECFRTMGQFLQSQIISSEYKRLLEEENKLIPNPNRQLYKRNQEKTERMRPCSQMDDEQQEIQEKKHPFHNAHMFQQISGQNLQLQEQALLDSLELAFLNGILPGINYHDIDHNQQLDDLRTINLDLEDKYFEEISPEEIEEKDLENNTGIQDF